MQVYPARMLCSERNTHKHKELAAEGASGALSGIENVTRFPFPVACQKASHVFRFSFHVETRNWRLAVGQNPEPQDRSTFHVETLECSNFETSFLCNFRSLVL
jgi:hypothetical protein